MKNVLIIGYGNTLRGDDAAGIRAAELILKAHPEFHCICMHQLIPDLAEQIAEHDIVFFIDADKRASKIEVRCVKADGEINQPHTHFVSPQDLLNLSYKLYNRLPFHAYVIGIPASEFEFSEDLSDKTAQEVMKCPDLVESLLR